MLNDVWGELGACKSAHDYVAVACQYLQLLLAHFGVPEVAKLLNASDVVLINYGLHYCQPACKPTQP